MKTFKEELQKETKIARADLPGLDVNLFFGGVYLDVSWE